MARVSAIFLKMFPTKPTRDKNLHSNDNLKIKNPLKFKSSQLFKKLLGIESYDQQFRYFKY